MRFTKVVSHSEREQGISSFHVQTHLFAEVPRSSG